MNLRHGAIGQHEWDLMLTIISLVQLKILNPSQSLGCDHSRRSKRILKWFCHQVRER